MRAQATRTRSRPDQSVSWQCENGAALRGRLRGPTGGYLTAGLSQFLFYLKFLLLESRYEHLVWRRSRRLIAKSDIEPGMFGVKCGNMG